MNTLMAVISVAVVIGLFTFFILKVVTPMMSGGRAGVQNRMIQKYIDDYNHQIRADQMTTIKLQMPASWKGSMILVRPETLMGKLTSPGEVSVNNPAFDRAFKVNGSNAARVQEILTPRLCEALLRFRERAGKFQLNEDSLICAYGGLGTDKVPHIVNEMLEVAKVAGT